MNHFVGTTITIIVGMATFYLLLNYSSGVKTIATGKGGLVQSFSSINRTAEGR